MLGCSPAIVLQTWCPRYLAYAPVRYSKRAHVACLPLQKRLGPEVPHPQLRNWSKLLQVRGMEAISQSLEDAPRTQERQALVQGKMGRGWKQVTCVAHGFRCQTPGLHILRLLQRNATENTLKIPRIR